MNNSTPFLLPPNLSQLLVESYRSVADPLLGTDGPEIPSLFEVRDILEDLRGTIEDDVVVYAGATVLGGETVIGKGSVIGGNAWVVESVPPGSRVSVRIETEVKRGSHTTRIPRKRRPTYSRQPATGQRAPLGRFLLP